ncbi:MAG: radical SAM protein [Clostridia bacterium]|nr:radical SAM protein [Clostridia bacterium]
MKLSMHLLEIEITTRCNLNCLHCYNRGYENIDMPYEQIEKYIKFANENCVSNLVISGGEASLHKDFFRLCEFLKGNRKKLTNIKKIVLQTNGNIKNIDLSNLTGFDYIHLSFDLDDNKIRKIDSNETIKLAKKLQEIGISPYFFTTIHKNNMNHIDEIIKIANENNIRIAFNFCMYTGRNKDVLLSHEERILAIKKLLEYEKQGKISKLRNPYINSYKRMTNEDQEKFKIRGGCTAGIASCTILSNGDVIPCPFFRIVCGNVNNESLENIWFNSENFKELRDRKKYEICGDCKYISYCGGCRNSAYETSHKLNGFDKNCVMLGNA